jgi:predicted homoserine dehydrogenase-like protein
VRKDDPISADAVEFEDDNEVLDLRRAQDAHFAPEAAPALHEPVQPGRPHLF